MEFNVRGEIFQIDLVNNWVHENYSDLVEMTMDFQELQVDIAEYKGLTLQQVKEKKSKIMDYKKRMRQIKEDILKEILESNGYDYNRAWWQRKVSPDDTNEFMLCCVKKDMQPGKHSKVKKKK